MHNIILKVQTLSLAVMLAVMAMACGPAEDPSAPAPTVTASPTGQPSPPPAAGDIIFDMKTEYQLGEPVDIVIRNDSDSPYYYQSYYPACYNLQFFDDSPERRPYPYADPPSEERLLAPGQFIVPQGTHCDLITEESLEPGERVVLFTWDQQICVEDRWGGVQSAPVEPGKYQVRGEFSQLAGVIGPGVDHKPDSITAGQWDFTINSPETGSGPVTTPAPTPPEVSGGGSESEEEAAAIDYAVAVGVDMDEARRRADLLEQVRPTLDSIRKEVSEDVLAGLSIEHQPDLHVRLRLTDDPSPTLKSIIDESPVPIIVTTDAPLSLSESQRRLERARPGLQEAVPELMGAWIDERTGDVVLDVFIEDDPEQVVEAKSRIEATADSLAQETGLPVRIVYLPAPVTH